MSTYIPLGVSLGVAFTLWNVANDPRAAGLPSTDRVVITMTLVVVLVIGMSATVIAHAIRSRQP